MDKAEVGALAVTFAGVVAIIWFMGAAGLFLARGLTGMPRGYSLHYSEECREWLVTDNCTNTKLKASRSRWVVINSAWDRKEDSASASSKRCAWIKIEEGQK